MTHEMKSNENFIGIKILHHEDMRTKSVQIKHISLEKYVRFGQSLSAGLKMLTLNQNKKRITTMDDTHSEKTLRISLDKSE